MDEKRPFSGFIEVPHKADIAIDVFARSLPELFINAAWGLYHILGVRKGTGDLEKIHFTLDDIDIEGLLISFLNELLYQVEKGLAAEEINLQLEHNHLEAAIDMATLKTCQRPVKAVTYNEIKITQSEEGFKTRIVMDI